MANKWSFIVIVLLGFSGMAQEAMSEKKAHKDADLVTLNQRFSTKVLNAYQENSNTKVADAFAYFQLLTDASLDVNLKKEVIANIYNLFQNPNALVIDFTSDALDKIPLAQFVQKLLLSEPILFTISNEARYDGVSFQSWNTNYTVTRTKLGVISKTNVMQTIYFYETNKAFGGTTKTVFSTLLGSM